jgi:hypothetical protein
VKQFTLDESCGGGPLPFATARALPSLVRARMRSRSNSVRPPSTVSIDGVLSRVFEGAPKTDDARIALAPAADASLASLHWPLERRLNGDMKD